MLASYRHMFNHQLEHDVRHYWDNHMSASFMVDPLGLRLIDQIGVDKVMWSSRLPAQREHVRLLGEVAGRRRRGGRPGGRREDRQHQHQEVPRPRRLGSSTTMTTYFASGAAAARHSRTARPRPDVPRDRRAPAGDHEGEGRRRPRAARQRQRRVRDGCELAAARRGPVARGAAGGGRARRRRASAPVHAVPRGQRHRSRSCPPTTSTGRCISNSTRGSSISRRCSPSWSRPVRRIAVDELTGAMRRAAGRLFPAGPPSDAALVVGPGQAGQDARPDLLHPQGVPDHRGGRRRGAEGAGAGRASDRPVGAVRPARLRTRRHRQHARGHLAGDAQLRRTSGRLDHHR